MRLCRERNLINGRDQWDNGCRTAATALLAPEEREKERGGGEREREGRREGGGGTNERIFLLTRVKE